jgi:hypothetical protein
VSFKHLKRHDDARYTSFPGIFAFLLTPLVEAFDRFGIAYYIGGSVASSVHGRRRYTQDVDVVAALQLKHVQALVAMLQQAYYIDADMIRSAIHNRSSFNLLVESRYVVPGAFLKSLRNSYRSRREHRAVIEKIKPGEANLR